MIALEQFSAAAKTRVSAPRFRGQLTEEDAADKGLALVKAGSGEGKVYLFLDEAKTVREARFLAFGETSSIPVLDAFAETAEGLPIETACALAGAALRERLGAKDSEEPTPERFAFLPDLQQKLKAAAKEAKATAPAAGRPGYKRRPVESMNERDRAWFTLSAPKKIVAVEKEIRALLARRVPSCQPEDVTLYHIAKDTEVSLRFSDRIDSRDRPNILRWVEDACRSSLHPDLCLKEAVPG